MEAKPKKTDKFSQRKKDAPKPKTARKPPVRKPKAPKVGEQKVQIHLRTNHCINGKMYGPGKVWVTAKVASVLLDNEQKVLQAEINFRRQGVRKIVDATGQRPPRMVDEETFYQYMAR